MALISKSEFARQAALTVSNLGNYIKRGKVFESEEFPGYIDSDLEANYVWLEQRRTKLAQKGKLPPEKPGVDAEKPNENAKTAAPAQEKSADKPAKKKQPLRAAKELLELDEKKKRAEIERIESTTRLNELRIQKQEGELIPFSLIQPIMVQLMRSVTSAFKQGGENLIIEFTHRHSLTAAQQAELRKALKEIINLAVDEAVDDAKTTSERISEEFKLTKSPAAA